MSFLENYKEIDAQVQESVKALNLNPEEVEHIKQVDFTLAKEGLDLDQKTLEKLRVACQLWDVDLRIKEIKSHRKVIGPVIVLVKKALAPVIRFFLKDFIRQQKDFNAAIVALVADSLKKKSK